MVVVFQYKVKVENNNNAKKKRKRKIYCRLRIKQIKLDPITSESYFIAEFINCNLLTRNKNLQVMSIILLQHLVKYL